MRWTTILIPAATIFFVGTSGAYSQDSTLLGRSLGEFRHACIGGEASGRFERSGTSSFACSVPNGDRIVALVVSQRGVEGRIVGVMRELRSFHGSQASRATTWLADAKRLRGIPDTTILGRDGCLFAEWRNERTISLLLHCGDRMTSVDMLRSATRHPEGSRQSRETVTKIE
jgi:hypothetical protein